MADRSGVLRVSPTCSIPLAELAWRFSRSGGPGGQHANTSDTRAEVRFDVRACSTLGPRQRTRLLERLGPEVRVVASDERSQARNRDLALERLAARLEAACARALTYGGRSYKSVKSILEKHLESVALPQGPAPPAPPAHENVRGPGYYT